MYRAGGLEVGCLLKAALIPMIVRYPAAAGPVPSELAALLLHLDLTTVGWDFLGTGKGADIRGNPWQYPPLAVVNAGAKAVRSFFTAAFAEGTRPIQRPLKVVIIGKETVGKTR